MPADVEISSVETQDDFQAQPMSAAPGKVGRASRRTQQALLELVNQMRFETRRMADGRIEGPLRPCTVVNFNPVALEIQGQIRLTIPRPGTTKHHQVKLPWRGREMVGHYCVIASPHIAGVRADKEPVYYTSTVGHEQDSELPIDVPKREPRAYNPHSIGCEIWHHYNSAEVKLMGGILMFDQDIHWLSRTSLEAHGNKIYVPERKLLPGSWRYAYTLREADLDEELERIFEAQRAYCEVVIQNAHALFLTGDEVQRQMITNTDREWARFARHMGYLDNDPEWLTAKLSIAGEIKNLKVCPYCGAQQKRPDIHFCPQNHPYDAYATFKAGLVVPEAYLEVLPEEQLDEVRAIQAERKARGKGGKKKAETPAAEGEGK